MGGTAIAQVASGLSIPILAVLYAPEDLGGAQVAVSIMSTVGIIGCLKIEQLVPRAKDGNDLQAVVALGVIATGVMAVATLLIQSVVVLISDAHYHSSIWIIPIGVAIAGANQLYTATALWLRRYSLINRSRLEQGFVSPVALGIMGFTGFGAWGIVIASLLQQSGGTWRLVRGVRPNVSIQSIMRPGGDRLGVLANNASVLKAAIPASFLNTAAWHLPLLLFVICYGPVIGGAYSLAYRLVIPVINLFGNSLGQAVQAELGAAIRARSGAHRVLKDAIKLGLKVACLIVLGGGVAGFLLGRYMSEWPHVGEFVLCMGIIAGLYVIVNPFGQLVVIVGAQRKQLPIDAFRAIAISLTIPLMSAAGASAPMCAALVCVVMSLFYALYMFLFIRIRNSVVPTEDV